MIEKKGRKEGTWERWVEKTRIKIGKSNLLLSRPEKRKVIQRE